MLEGKRNLTWSAKHTRLRYQMVLACLSMVLISKLEVTAFKIPGFFEFSYPPEYAALWLCVLGFSLFSVVAFFYQTKLERDVLIFSGDRTVVELDLLLDKRLPVIIDSVPDFDGGVAGRAIWENLTEKDKSAKDFDSKLFSKNSKIASECKTSLSQFHNQTLNTLMFWRTDLDALLPDVSFISGANVIELRRMYTLLNSAEKSFEDFSTSWAYFDNVALAAIKFDNMLGLRVDGKEFTHAMNEIEKHLRIIKSSFKVSEDFAGQVLEGISKNNKTVKFNLNQLGQSIPFWLSIGLLILSAYYSALNLHDFWEVQNAK